MGTARLLGASSVFVVGTTADHFRPTSKWESRSVVSQVVGLLLVILNHSAQGHDQILRSRSKEALFLALVLFYKSRPTIAPPLRSKCAAVQLASGRRSRSTLTQPVLCNIRNSCTCCMAWDEFWPRRKARKRDSAGRWAHRHFFYFYFFLANPGKPMRAPDEKQRSNKVHPNIISSSKCLCH